MSASAFFQHTVAGPAIFAGIGLHTGAHVRVAIRPAAPNAGVHTLAHVHAYVDHMVLVEDMAILEAMRALMRKARIVPEPAAAAATAALLGGFLMIEPSEHVVVVVSGGNVDPERVRSLL